MRAARFVRMILAAHGSADPRSATVTHAVAAQLRTLRPGLDVRVGFCEQNAPNLRDVLGAVRGSAVVTPLLLASAYHARVDIPGLIEQSGADVLQADTLGEDPRLVEVMRQRLAEADVAAGDPHLGVLVVAVGSSRPEANARTATVADALAHNTRWSGVAVAHAAGPRPSVAAGIEALRRRGARRIILAPWFIAPGRITDRVAEIARDAGVRMAAPLGAHALLAETLLDRFDQAVAARAAA
ncbi:MAG TPA: sirohydrochlorin chelatase [Mycobacterium sp.]|nr:sirohydrochlorin chelatase [Mycobacterium sp.]